MSLSLSISNATKLRAHNHNHLAFAVQSTIEKITIINHVQEKCDHLHIKSEITKVTG